MKRADTGSRTEADAGRHAWATRPDREQPDVDLAEDSRPLSPEERADLVAELVALQARHVLVRSLPWLQGVSS